MPEDTRGSFRVDFLLFARYSGKKPNRKIGFKPPDNKDEAGMDMDGKTFWKQGRKTVTAPGDLDLILCSTVYLPMRFWRKNFWFTGALDETLHECTQKAFPAKVLEGKTRPLFVLKPFQQGFSAVAPCTSRTPYRFSHCHFIHQGCRLLHTGFEVDKTSYILNRFRFNIPVSLAETLRFRGEVPLSCIG
jgi:hypothetical protein